MLARTEVVPVFDIVVFHVSMSLVALLSVLRPLVSVDGDCGQGNAQSETSVVQAVHAFEFKEAGKVLVAWFQDVTTEASVTKELRARYPK